MSKFDPYEHLKVILNPNGSLTRLIEIPTVEASQDPITGQHVVSKDITLNAEKKTWMRIFRPTKLPSNDNSVARLPIVIYAHGGGWILFNAKAATVHELCCNYASELPAIIVSVEYRLSPESRLPAQYDDFVDAIQWVNEQGLNQNGEQWLRDYGDFSRCYLYGNSNGGNIVFYGGLRALDLDLKALRIVGLMMNQPMFSGSQRTESEIRFATDQLLPLPVLDLIWELTLPPGIDKNHRYCNPMIPGPHQDKLAKLARCLVIGFGGDPMIDRQQAFVTMLVKQGVRVEARFDELGFHGIDTVDPIRAAAVLSLVKEFV